MHSTGSRVALIILVIATHFFAERGLQLAFASEGNDLGALRAEVEQLSTERNGWPRLQLTRIAIARNDTQLAHELLTKTRDRGDQLLALRAVGEVIADSYTDNNMLAITSEIESWHILGDAGAGEVSSSVANGLLSQGRLKLSERLAREYGISIPVECYVVNGRISDALAAHKDASGRDNVESAINVAVNVIRSGQTDRAIEFLQAGWPNRQHEWSIALCLTVASQELDVGHLIPLCTDRLLRRALVRACNELSEWKSLYDRSLNDTVIEDAVSAVEPTDSLGLAHLLAACNHRRIRMPQTLGRLIEQSIKETSGQVRPVTGHNDRLLLLEELAYYRLSHSELDLLVADITIARTALGNDAVLGAVNLAASRIAWKVGRESSLSLAQKLSEPALRISVELGVWSDNLARSSSEVDVRHRYLERKYDHYLVLLTDPLFDD